MKNYRDVLLAPVVSEKSYSLLDGNKYTFLVAPDANKTEIKIAVEKVFNVKVLSVNTMNREGKRKRTLDKTIRKIGLAITPCILCTQTQNLDIESLDPCNRTQAGNHCPRIHQ